MLCYSITKVRVIKENMNKKLSTNKIISLIPSPSDFSSNQEWENACWEKISNQPEVFGFLLTPAERRKIIKRLAVIKELQAGKSYRTIGVELNLSLQTIHNIKKIMNDEGIYYSYFSRVRKIKQKEKEQLLNTRKIKIARPEVGRRYRRTKFGKVRLV